MKNKNQRDLEKHWADQAHKKTAAEQLRIKMEKLREKMGRDRKSLSEDQAGGEQKPEAEASHYETESNRLNKSSTSKARAKR